MFSDKKAKKKAASRAARETEAEDKPSVAGNSEQDTTSPESPREGSVISQTNNNNNNKENSKQKTETNNNNVDEDKVKIKSPKGRAGIKSPPVNTPKITSFFTMKPKN